MDVQQNESRNKKKTIYIPRRTPSIVTPPRPIIFITPDKKTCSECTCFPKEDPYVKPKKLNPCQQSPITLYKLAANAVDQLKWPDAFKWSQEDVVLWLSEEVGLPQYKECILDNYIDGMRLLMLEDPSKLPQIGINYFKHIQLITSKVRDVFSTEFIKFTRSIGLPPRKPLTHCTWLKSRTGPSWGIRQKWTRSDLLRRMKIIMPEPSNLNHWDLVWYHKADFPKVMFARIPKTEAQQIPQYVTTTEICREYLRQINIHRQDNVCREHLVIYKEAPLRSFKTKLYKWLPDHCHLFMDEVGKLAYSPPDAGIPGAIQYIWMEHPPEIIFKRKEEPKKKLKICIPKDSRLLPKKISLTGLAGKELLLARRKMPKRKYFL